MKNLICIIFLFSTSLLTSCSSNESDTLVAETQSTQGAIRKEFQKDLVLLRIDTVMGYEAFDGYGQDLEAGEWYVLSTKSWTLLPLPIAHPEGGPGDIRIPYLSAWADSRSELGATSAWKHIFTGLHEMPGKANGYRAYIGRRNCDIWFTLVLFGDEELRMRSHGGLPVYYFMN